MSLNDWRSLPRGPRPDLAERNRANAKHGLTRTPAYRSWESMKVRVLRHDSKDFANYGGRGIDMDPRWIEFAVFIADMGARPIGTTLGRIDNERGYWPGNCRWEVPEEQLNNRRISRFVECNGQRMTVAQWARVLGCSRQVIRHRLENGWSDEQAVTTKPSYLNRRVA